MPRATNGNVSIHYQVVGSGPPLVMQHGFMGCGDDWIEAGYVEALRTQFQLLVPDLRGHGQSDKPHAPAAYTPAHFAGDLAAVLDHAGVSRATYWGYSQGAGIGFAVARHAPERLAALIIGAASITGTSAFARQQDGEDPLIALLRRPLRDGLSLFGEWMTPTAEARFLANDAKALIAFREQRLVTGGFEDVAARIAIPALIYSGTDDPIHDQAQQSAAAIAGATFVSLPGLSHIAGFFRSELVLPSVRQFLAARI